LDGLTFRHRKRLAAFSIPFNQSDYRINKHFRITEPRLNVCFLERDKNFIITFLPSFVKGVINDRRLFRNNAGLDKMMVEKRQYWDTILVFEILEIIEEITSFFTYFQQK